MSRGETKKVWQLCKHCVRTMSDWLDWTAANRLAMVKYCVESSDIFILQLAALKERKEGNVLFNDAFKTFYCVNLPPSLYCCDPLSYFSFQPVLHDWCIKGRSMCYPVCGMVHIKEPLLLIDKSSLCGGSGFPFSLSEWSLTICLTPYNRR